MFNKKAKADDSKSKGVYDETYSKLKNVDLNSISHIFSKEQSPLPTLYPNVYTPIILSENYINEKKQTTIERDISDKLNLFKLAYKLKDKDDVFEFNWLETEQSFDDDLYDGVVKCRIKDPLTHEGYVVFSVVYGKQRNYPVMLITRRKAEKCENSKQLEECLRKIDY